jgi:ATP-binding cassette subfamily B protein
VLSDPYGSLATGHGAGGPIRAGHSATIHVLAVRAVAERDRHPMLIRLLRAHIGPYRGQIAALVVLQLAATFVMLVLPTLNADIIDKGVVVGNTGYILRVGGIMLALAFGQIACAGGAAFFGSRAAMAVGRDVRASVFGRVQSFSAREVAHFGAPSLITRATNDVQQIQLLVLMTATLTLTAPFMCIGGIVLAINQDAGLSTLLIVIVPVLVAIIGLLVWRMQPLGRAMQERLDTVNRVLREQLAGLRVIRAFVKDSHETARFATANGELTDTSLRYGQLMALMFPLVFAVVNIATVAVVWFGAHRIDSGAMQIGALSAFLQYLMQILMSVMMATFMFAMLPRAEVCAERIQEVLDTETSLRPPDNPVTELVRHGELELRGVGFRYPGAEAAVLRDVSLTARPGQVTAIIGSTGAGKSTLLSLIPRLSDVTEGTVLVDGVDVRALDPKLLAATVAIVPQRPYLFSGTVASNLRYGDPDATDEQLWHALDIAQARGFVEAMPDGLATSIAQGGTNVSGGQRQRLAIARALVRRPEIYLFDDSFSALDYATDAALRAALADETAAATVVIVAQRVATIRDADQIIVLDEGRVVGVGTHPDLMADNDTYREIVLSQLTEQEAVA